MIVGGVKRVLGYQEGTQKFIRGDSGWCIALNTAVTALIALNKALYKFSQNSQFSKLAPPPDPTHPLASSEAHVKLAF